jgi:hypothetical protein
MPTPKARADLQPRDDLSAALDLLKSSLDRKRGLLKTLFRNTRELNIAARSGNFIRSGELIEQNTPVMECVDAVDFDIRASLDSALALCGEPESVFMKKLPRIPGSGSECASLYNEISRLNEQILELAEQNHVLLIAELERTGRDIREISAVRQLKKSVEEC